ncbi:MAG TPA: hypothetical protein VFA83_06335 [Acidimicrobiales bacterium]|nr:hypothetical protein [Acidimicrobiales bacterium]
MKGDRVEVLVDVGGGSTQTFDIEATKAGRCVEVTTGRGMVEVTEVTRSGTPVRSARFMSTRVVALVEHPSDDGEDDDGPRPARRRAPADDQPSLSLDG